MSEFVKKFFAILAMFVIASVIVAPIKKSLAKKSVSIESLQTSLGGGSLFAVLGGYKSLVADFVWIKSYINWEKRNIAKCVSAIEMATQIDPEMTMFWVQGSRIIAFDIPHWLWDKIPEKNRTEDKLNFFKKRQGLEAIAFVNKALKMFPNNYELLIQKGQIAIAIDDYLLAQECFYKATTVNDGFYARRIYASLLAKNGDLKKSIYVLKTVLRETEKDNPVRTAIIKEIDVLEKLSKKIEQ